MTSNIKNDINKIIFYCKKNNIKINKSKFSCNCENNIIYGIDNVKQWYKFFDNVYCWNSTQEGVLFWFNHQLNLVYFALHFEMQGYDRIKLISYITNLMTRYWYDQKELNANINNSKREFLKKCVDNNLIQDDELLRFNIALNKLMEYAI